MACVAHIEQRRERRNFFGNLQIHARIFNTTNAMHGNCEN